MRGDLVIERGTLRDLMKLHFVEQGIMRDERMPRLVGALLRARSLTTRLSQINYRTASRANVEHHYDLGNDVFEMLLDPLMQYTCGFFPDDALPTGTGQALAAYEADPPLDLDEAQRRRIRIIINKLGISEGMRVLDIGCGWGGLAAEIVRQTGAQVTGISLSKQQLAYAQALAEKIGVADRIDLKLLDYRDLQGTYDRVTAAGVLEHIGKLHYKTFLDTIERVLAPDGMALVDTAGRMTRAGGTNPWLAKYIFPGGYIPALSEICRAVDRTRLIAMDVEVSTLQYALTVREWGRRLAANAERIRATRGEPFLRMLELYLASSEMAMLHGPFVNFQVQLANSRFASPLNRPFALLEAARGAPTQFATHRPSPLLTPSAQGSAGDAGSAARQPVADHP